MQRYFYRSVIFLAAFLSVTGKIGLAAALPDDEGAEALVSLYGQACEPVKDGEAKSSVRVRATDKASFAAVEKISELSDYRNKFSAHDFNVLVYQIVDNYVEDMTARTTAQDETKICVEVTGYLDSEDILNALNENFQKFAVPAPVENNVNTRQENYPDELAIEDPAATQTSASDFPPQPKPVINPQVAALDEDAPAMTISRQSAPKDLGQPHLEVPTAGRQAEPSHEPVTVVEEEPYIAKVYVEKTVYYNNTTTNRFYKIFADLIDGKEGAEVSRHPLEANYTLKSKVLRAKVDPINQQTNRLQLVVAVELLNNTDKTSVVEHQNRFVLFEAQDDEQKVASELMEKLLKKAAEQVSKKIKTSANRAIITPADTNYGVFAPKPPPLMQAPARP